MWKRARNEAALVTRLARDRAVLKVQGFCADLPDSEGRGKRARSAAVCAPDVEHHSHRHVRARESATVAVRTDRPAVTFELTACYDSQETR